MSDTSNKTNNELLSEILEGMFEYNDRTYQSIDQMLSIINTKFKVDHTPIIELDFESEVNYYENLLAEQILKDGYSVSELEADLVKQLKMWSYACIRGKLNSGYTIRFDSTKFNQMFINGIEYSRDYTFNGANSNSFEYVTILLTQTPFDPIFPDMNFGQLNLNTSDIPLHDCDLFINIGTQTTVEPDIDSFLSSPNCISLYIDGNYSWRISDITFVRKIKSTGQINLIEKWSTPFLVDLIMPNQITIEYISDCYSADISGAVVISNQAILGNPMYGRIYLPSVTSLGNRAIFSCNNITEVIMGDKCTSLSYNSISSCSNLQSLRLSGNLKQLYSNSLDNLPGLTTLAVGQGYNIPETNIPMSSKLNWECFVDIMTNVADRSSTTIGKFIVNSTVLTALANAEHVGNHDAEYIYSMMNSKNWSITTS